LNPDFSINIPGNLPAPNLFAVTANQIANNAAAKAQKFFMDHKLAMILTAVFILYSPEMGLFI
jgi:hypothetical protein